MLQSKELVAASTTPMILSILSRGETYGYAIIREVREVSDAKIEWSDGMLYPVLRRLETQGLVKSRWRLAEDTGKKRRYYQLKSKGKEALGEHQSQWKMTNRVLNKLWNQEPCTT